MVDEPKPKDASAPDEPRGSTSEAPPTDDPPKPGAAPFDERKYDAPKIDAPAVDLSTLGEATRDEDTAVGKRPDVRKVDRTRGIAVAMVAAAAVVGAALVFVRAHPGVLPGADARLAEATASSYQPAIPLPVPPTADPSASASAAAAAAGGVPGDTATAAAVAEAWRAWLDNDVTSARAIMSPIVAHTGEHPSPGLPATLAITPSPDGVHAIVDQLGAALVVDLKQGSLVGALAHAEWCGGLLVSQRTTDGAWDVLDPSTAKPVVNLAGRPVAATSDGGRLVYATPGASSGLARVASLTRAGAGAATLHDGAALEPPHALAAAAGHAPAVTLRAEAGSAISHDGKRLLGVVDAVAGPGARGTRWVVAWDLDSGKAMQASPLDAESFAAVLARDGRRAFVAVDDPASTTGSGSAIAAWDLTAPAAARVEGVSNACAELGPVSPRAPLELSPDEKWLVVGDAERVCTFATGKRGVPMRLAWKSPALREGPSPDQGAAGVFPSFVAAGHEVLARLGAGDAAPAAARYRTTDGAELVRGATAADGTAVVLAPEVEATRRADARARELFSAHACHAGDVVLPAAACQSQ